MEEEALPDQTENRFRFRLFAYIIIALVLLGLFVLWISRGTLADNVIQSQLDSLDVEADYEIGDIGLRKQVIRNLVIGDPDRPDLTAELVEVGNSLTLGGVGINWVRASGVRLFGRLQDGKLTFGELDKFMDPADDSPLALPDLWLGLSDAKVRIDSEFGAFGAAVNGEGYLQDGFDGEVAVVSQLVEAAGCRLQDPSYFGEIAIRARQPRLTGPLRIPSLQCDETKLAAEDMAAQLALQIGEDLGSWTGDVGLIGGPVRYASYASQELKMSVELEGDLARSTGNFDVTASGLRFPFGRANVAELNGPFALGYDEEAITAEIETSPVIRNISITKRPAAQLSSVAASTRGTPIGPIVRRLARAVRLAGSNLDLSGDVKLQSIASGTTISLDALQAQSASGANLSLDSPLLLAFGEAGTQLEDGSSIRIAGGGFPDARLFLNEGRLANGISGRLAMANYQAGSASLKIPSLAFSPTGGGTALAGRLILTGPLADGRVTGLQLPISGSVSNDGRLNLFDRCFDLQFASLRAAAFAAGPSRTRICPQGRAVVSGRGANIDVAASAPGLSLQGAIGQSKLAIRSGAAEFALDRGMTARDVSLQLGEGDDPTRMDMALLEAFFGPVITGTVGGANGKIANVPLLLEQVEGDWRFENGEFLADAQLQVRDEQPVERFRPLLSDDVAIRFAGDDITATGLLREPETRTPVASVDIGHAVSTSTGRALLDVESLIFNDNLQPEQLTPLTLGIIANVQGEISGTGRIDWDDSEDGIKSNGKFLTNGMNLAAAFGPVTGLSGEIEFSDLLELVTAPGQEVRMAEVNPGVAAFNGQISYRLLPGYKMQIEAGQWPFAGGTLYLEPTILDLSEEAERRLQFTVEAVDAAQFLTQFEFENLTATGVFDGRLPMVFDQEGGRISGGYLVAREGGGSLAYVGELTYKDMGTLANFAFNALRSIRYRELTIGMNGAIDGEIITEVKFAGLQQGDDASRNFFTRQLERIPIEFNVRIQAPFMQLMSSARSLYEPEILVGQNLPALLRAQEARARDVAETLSDDDE